MPKLPVEKVTRRKFLGKTENFVDKAERLHEGKHLKAYLSGAKRFKSYKWNPTKQIHEIVYYPVLEELYGQFVDNSKHLQSIEEFPIEKILA
jgi:hypothetical protein